MIRDFVRDHLVHWRVSRVLVIRDLPGGFTFSVNGDPPQFVRVRFDVYDHERNGDFA